MKAIVLALVILLLCKVSLGQGSAIPVVASGTINRIENFQSKYVKARNVDVWLPDGYSVSKKYSVLYMHDGQMLYDSSQTWNKKAWDVDDVLAVLLKEGKINDVIVVGIWNGGNTRHADYFPQKPFESLTSDQQSFVNKQLKQAGRTTEPFTPISDSYLKFIVKELKPYIDKKYSVYKNRAHTYIAGSSMGGLISIYAVCEYPKVFGGAACLSTHWPGIFSVENNPIPSAFESYLSKKLPSPSKHKIYFDYGDKTLDSLYGPLQRRVDAVMETNGFNEKNWVTLFFPGKNHSEVAWRERFDIPMQFLLKK